MIKKIISIAFCLVFVSCSSLSKKSNSNVKLRPIEEKVLANGLKLIFIQDDSLPRLGFTLLVGVGSLQDKKGQEGLNSLTAALLEDGTAKRSATELADEFGQLGSDLGPSGSLDYTVVSTDGLVQFKAQLLDLFSDSVLHPAFREAELNRKRSQSIAALEKLVDNPNAYADAMLDKNIFGEHPYAFPSIGEVNALKKINRAMVKQQYETYYVPNNSTLAVYGKLDADYKAQVEKVFSDWKAKEIPKSQWAEAKSADPKSIKIYSKPGLTQAQIRLGQVGFQRNIEDYLQVRLANVILGGAFASRLNQRVRDDLGLTYSISSSFEGRKERGPIDISTFTRNDKVGETIKNSILVIKKFEQEGVNEPELVAAKALLTGQFPASIETVDRYAFNLLILKYYGVPENYLSHFLDNVNAVSLKQVNSAIKKYYKADLFKVIVYADAKLVEDQIKPLAPVEIETIK